MILDTVGLTPERLQELQHHVHQRRRRLADHVATPVILWSGGRIARNFAANAYPHRASSHFLYFAGLPLQNVAIRLDQGRCELFMDEVPPSSVLWQGESPTRSELAAWIGADADYPLTQLQPRSPGAATIAVQDRTTQAQQISILGRAIEEPSQANGIDQTLVQAITNLRLRHDSFGIQEIRQAAAVTVQAHQAGMAATPAARTSGGSEAQIRAVMEQVILAQGMTPAYSSIVTVHGEVLHNEQYHHRIQAGDLILADVGAESPLGWASDVTRTWPVSGHFSRTQRDLYEVVLAAHDACIAAARPGVEYRDLHLLGAKVITEGLIDLGILHGEAQDLVDQDAHALFFPHGLGHLLGLDVHDMEDLGDLAGYAPGRRRSDRFGLGYLRLDRPLQAGMVVTIEPGFYQVPAILQDRDRRAQYQACVNWDRLEQFSDVRGIRIEDDVLITETGTEVLTAALPTSISAIEAMVQGSGSCPP